MKNAHMTPDTTVHSINIQHWLYLLCTFDHYHVLVFLKEYFYVHQGCIAYLKMQYYIFKIMYLCDDKADSSHKCHIIIL